MLRSYLVHRRGRHHRLIPVADGAGIELRVGAEAHGVVRFIGRDAVGLLVPHVDYAEIVEAAFALRDHQVVLEKSEPLDLDRRRVRDERRPVLLGRIAHRSRHDLEVLRAFVGGDVEPSLVVIDVVLVSLFTRNHDLELTGRIVRGQVADLSRGFRIGADEQYLPVERSAGAEIEQFALLLEHQIVLVGPDDVAPELVGPLGDGVLGREKQCLVVVRPDNGAGTLDALGRERSGAEVLHSQRELAIARRVHRKRQPVGIVTDRVAAEAEELVPFRELVQIQEDLLLPFHRAFATAHVRILLALFGARVIPVVPVAGRDAQIGLLDAPEHLLVERFLQGLPRRHDGFGVRVLGFEVRRDFRVGLVPHPEIVVLEGVAVDLRFARHLFRDRCGGRLLGGGYRGHERKGCNRNGKQEMECFHIFL